ncbi:MULTISPECIES: hypothetical protein [Embleya]|uniref:WXG100 family type VII secretion target n=2 Tax=Embleya TaxID=2699295 RepID=A0A1T3NUA2_9ACTN|nr:MULTISPECIES: hypothetical protein [Embleya]OPC80231.1 hypothetical protein B4N89_04065 [Embleya scabrispora]GCD99279.1 hypothetical protein EHYA_06993 [Embleya hyalina]
MASDFKITYDQVHTAQLEMKKVSDAAVLEIRRLQGKVDALLKPGSGLWLKLSSDELNTKYKTLSADLEKAILNIITFSQQFDKIVEAAQKLDSSMKAALQKSG